MRLLDRYLLKELLGPFFFGVAAFTCIISGGSVLFPIISKTSEYGVSLLTVFEIFLYRIPSIISIALPMSVLLAAILCFNRLSADSETTALRSVGIGLGRVLLPAIFLGMTISIFNILLNEYVMPRATSNSYRLLENIKNQGPLIKQNVNFTEYGPDRRPIRIVNVREVEEFDLSEITMAEYESGHLARVIRAERGVWDSQTGNWELFQGVMHTFSETDLERVMVIEFDKEKINSAIYLTDVTRDKYVEEMSAEELRNQIARLKLSGKDVTKDMIKYYLKFSMPFACLVFAVLGAVLGIRPQRGSSSKSGLAFSMLIIILYYILYSLGFELGMAKVLPPMLAAWLPNILVGGACLFLLRKLSHT